MRIEQRQHIQDVERKKNNKNRKSNTTTKPPLQKGDIVKGEVVDVKKQHIKLQLDNGEVIEARSSKKQTYYIGERVTFETQEASTKEIVLKPIIDENANPQMDKILQVLRNAGLENTEKNIQIVNQLMLEKMAINKDTVRDITMYSKRFWREEIKHIALLMKNDMLVSKESLEYIKNLEQGRNQITKELKVFAGDLSEQVNTKNGSKLIEIMLADNEKSVSVFTRIRNILTNPKQMIETTKNVIKENLGISNKVGEEGEKDTTVKAGITSDVKSLHVTETSVKDMQEKKEGNSFFGAEYKMKDILGEEESLRLQQKVKEIAKDFSIEESHKEVVSKQEEKENVENNEKSMENVKNVKNHILLDKNKEFMKLFEEVKNLTVPDDIKDATNKLLVSRITKILLQSEMFLTKEDLGDVEKVNKFYNKLYTKIVEVIKEGVEDSGESIKKVVAEAKNIKTSMEMMNQMHQNYQFLHLPINLNNQQINSELYILNHSKKKAKQERVTALLRLDFKNLGHLDIYVAKTDKNVEVNFYADTEDAMTSITKEKQLLYGKLVDQAFNVLGISVQMRKEDFNLFNDILTPKNKEESKQYIFDVRM